MKRTVWLRFVPILVVGLVLAACSGEDAIASAGDVSDETTTTAAPPGDAVVAEETTTTAAAGGNDPATAPPGAGSATLTIGDQTWTFDNYYCRFGPEQTKNERVSFSSGAFGTHEGVRTQLDVSIQDPDQQGRYEGEGTIQSVTFNDIEDFENPSVDFGTVSAVLGGSDFVIQVDGDKVRVEAVFNDRTTDEIDVIPGTLEATCGAG